mmetsp:Transcript_105492/g.339787  ORF Transcript_105492/g.339787 Transcript_105492/m.339787 type:complete len:207 (-) Transcript_105492:876-1496(-)
MSPLSPSKAHFCASRMASFLWDFRLTACCRDARAAEKAASAERTTASASSSERERASQRERSRCDVIHSIHCARSASQSAPPRSARSRRRKARAASTHSKDGDCTFFPTHGLRSRTTWNESPKSPPRLATASRKPSSLNPNVRCTHVTPLQGKTWSRVTPESQEPKGNTAKAPIWCNECRKRRASATKRVARVRTTMPPTIILAAW